MSRSSQASTSARQVPVVEVPIRRPGKPTSSHHCDALRTILREAGGDTTGLRYARKDELCRRVDALPLSRRRTNNPASRNDLRHVSRQTQAAVQPTNARVTDGGHQSAGFSSPANAPDSASISSQAGTGPSVPRSPGSDHFASSQSHPIAIEDTDEDYLEAFLRSPDPGEWGSQAQTQLPCSSDDEMFGDACSLISLPFYDDPPRESVHGEATAFIAGGAGAPATVQHCAQPAATTSDETDSDDEPLAQWRARRGRSRARVEQERQSADTDWEEHSMFFPEPRLQACETCFNEYPEDQFPGMQEWADCEHEQMPFCADCLGHHIAAQVDTSGFDRITCPHSDCEVQLYTEQIQKYADAPIRERHMNWINKKAIENTEQHMKCANHDCTFAGDIDRAMFSWMTCPECQTRTCTACETHWHPGISHDENTEAIRQEAEQQAARDTENQLSSDFIEHNTKACPMCHNPIEKNGGCEHMTCRAPRCGHEFCWLCLADYGPIRRDGNSQHRSSCRFYRAYDQTRDF